MGKSYLIHPKKNYSALIQSLNFRGYFPLNNLRILRSLVGCIIMNNPFLVYDQNIGGVAVFLQSRNGERIRERSLGQKYRRTLRTRIVQHFEIDRHGKPFTLNCNKFNSKMRYGRHIPGNLLRLLIQFEGAIRDRGGSPRNRDCSMSNHFPPHLD